MRATDASDVDLVTFWVRGIGSNMKRLEEIADQAKWAAKQPAEIRGRWIKEALRDMPSICHGMTEQLAVLQGVVAAALALPTIPTEEG